jgi:hypothetical protein
MIEHVKPSMKESLALILLSLLGIFSFFVHSLPPFAATEHYVSIFLKKKLFLSFGTNGITLI